MCMFQFLCLADVVVAVVVVVAAAAGDDDDEGGILVRDGSPMIRWPDRR